MHDVDPRIVALVLLQLAFNFGGISNQIQFVNLLVITQCHDGASDKARRTKVAAHGIEGDLHQCETCELKRRTARQKCSACPGAWSGDWQLTLPPLQLTCLLGSIPVARDSNRTMDMQ